MFRRNLPVRQRLIRAFGLFSGVLLLAVWLLNMAYLFAFERRALLENMRTHAAILARHSAAAVMLDDRATLDENLTSLRQMDHFAWAVILRPFDPARPAVNRALAVQGAPPETLDRYEAALNRQNNTLSGLDEAVVRTAIEHGGLRRGDLILAVDQRRDLRDMLELFVSSLLLNLAFLGAAMLVFNRIVGTVTGPMQHLTEIAETTGRTGIPSERADGQFDDEIGRLSQSFNLMLDNLAAREADLAHSRDELRALSLRLQQIREEERTHIAYEIHDELGQRLTALKFAIARPDDGSQRRELGLAIDAIIQIVRDLSWSLRPGVLDSLGLDAAIEWLGRDFQQRIGIRCKVVLPERTPELHPDQATDIFRICQELLTNVARHAQANRVDIALETINGGLRLEVRDNGIGIQSPVPGQRRSLGLLGIEERARRWQGRVDVVTRPAVEGTVTCIAMPVFPPDPHMETLS